MLFGPCKFNSTFSAIKDILWSAWVAQSVKRLTLAQVTISQFMGSSPASGSVLTARSLEPVPDSVSPFLSVPPPLMLCLSLSLKNKCLKKKKKKIPFDEQGQYLQRYFCNSSSPATAPHPLKMYTCAKFVSSPFLVSACLFWESF